MVYLFREGNDVLEHSNESIVKQSRHFFSRTYKTRTSVMLIFNIYLMIDKQ